MGEDYKRLDALSCFTRSKDEIDILDCSIISGLVTRGLGDDVKRVRLHNIPDVKFGDGFLVVVPTNIDTEYRVHFGTLVVKRVD